ncbi:M20 family metallopeptidase [Candidatus Saccharibacteria bacterium]|nr:M20 family metallopeptidase [Candidatus Saccharibacteria bacterium]MCL1963047.1 M20 family metallopeptidase [Candidatus Saccharibacteria bacterium]
MNKKPELKQILSDLVAFYPTSSNQKSVRKLLEYVQKFLSEIGLNSKILTNNGVHMLYASTKGKKTAKIMLQSHVDVVPADEKLRRTAIKNGRIYGRGVRDMLFCTASYLKFLYDQKDKLDDLDLSLCLTGDEEVGGANTVPHLLNQGYSADVVWLSDAGNRPDELVVSAKGGYNFDLIIHGTAHHGSRPWEGDNAAEKLIRCLRSFLSAFKKPANDVSTCTITELDAGDSINKGPATARAHLDIRYTNLNELKKYQKLVADLCEKWGGEVQNLLVLPNYTVDPNSELIQKYLTINESITGEKVRFIAVSGSSDARYFSQKNIPVIMTRPLSHGSHSDNEWVDLDSWRIYYEILTKYVLEIAAAKK